MSVSPKRKNMLVLRLIINSALMLDALDELGVHEEAEMYKLMKSIIPKLEDMVDSAHKYKQVRQSTVLSDLVQKVDTVIRKNYPE